MVQRFSNPGWFPTCALASLSGALLFLSDFPVHAWWLQFVALVPWLLALLRTCPGKASAAVAGLVLGGCYTVPLLVALEFPFLQAVGLGLYLTLLWVVLSLGSFVVLRFGPVLGSLAAASLAVLVEWIDFTVVPVWGTAQCFARVLSAWPWAIQFVAVTGMLGLVFVLVASQVLAVRLSLERTRRWALGLSLLLCLGLPAGLNTWFWIQRPIGSLTVAALGWTWEWPDNPGRKDPAGLVNARYLPMLRRAGADGARLAVSPEVGLWLGPEQKAELSSVLQAQAAQQSTALALGLFDAEQNDNRLLWVDPTGGVVGEYRKTHLVPFVENYRAGDGTLLAWTLAAPGGEAGGLRLGGMICQDDNFTDLARGYGRDKVQVMAVPTNDWRQVKDYHLENSVFRAVENRYGLVRAATNGISAIVTARGEIMATLDPFTEGAGLIVAKLPVFEGCSLYALWGDWPILALALGLLLAGSLGRLLGRRPVRIGEDSPA